MPVIMNNSTHTEEGITLLTRALGKLPMPSSSKRNILQEAWKQQIRRYSFLYPNAAFILKQVVLPQGITDPSRIRRFVESTAISPDEQAFLPQCTEIIPLRMWIADGYSGTDVVPMAQLGITHVICMGAKGYHDLCSMVPYMEHAIIKVPDLNEQGDTPLVGIIDDAAAYVRDILYGSTKHRVLVHCTRGTDWSAAIAVCMLMDLLGCTFQRGHEFVKKKRPTVSLPIVIQKAVREWWALEELRHDFPKGRGYRRFKWAREPAEVEGTPAEVAAEKPEGRR